MRILSGLMLCTCSLWSVVSAQSKSRETVVENGKVKLVLTDSGLGCVESYYAKDEDTEWRLVLESGSGIRPEPALKSRSDDNTRLLVQLLDGVDRREEGTRVTLSAVYGAHHWKKVIEMKKGDPFAHITVTDSIHGIDTVEYLLSTYSFRPDGMNYEQYKPLDFVFTPQLRPNADEVIADHTFRSPAFMMQKGGIFASLIPDVRTIDGRNRVLRSSADLEVETTSSPFISFGLMNWARKKEHVFYSHNDSLAVSVSDTTLSYGFYLYASASAPLREGFENVVRFEWDRFGHSNFMRPVGPQSEPFSSYIHKAWFEYLPEVAMSANYNGEDITLLRQARLAWSNNLPKAADNDCWFNVWFNSLRTAYGVYLWGGETGNDPLMQQAVGVLNLALLAPQHDGIAPSIFYVDSAGGHWIADHGWGGISHGEYLPMFHNAWTGYWLMQWSDVLSERKEEILRYTRAFGDFLVKHQHATGVIPSWYDPATLRPDSIFQNENAETAGAALLLAELYSRTKNETYLDAARKAMGYIITSILPENKWYDFETFFSCSRKPVGFYDSYTQQHPQNTLSMFMTAEACYSLFQITGEQRYKDTGARVLDYLCLYQQVWSPEWLSRELLGGFGVQNTDGEWSDSRQGYFAVTLMHYYELTKRREYFERGVAALRAMFSLFESVDSPRTAENYAHGSQDQLAGVTGIHWGTGSSVVSIHIIRRQYGDAFINVEQGWGVGIDGCRFSDVHVGGQQISFSLHDVVSSSRKALLKFGDLRSDSYFIEMNGTRLGEYSSEQLRKGIEVQL